MNRSRLFRLVSRIGRHAVDRNEHHQKNGSPSPDERYRELERESAEWSERVDRSVRKLDRITKNHARKVKAT
jgi:molecular chaperone GrpE (heat shock protein)